MPSPRASDPKADPLSRSGPQTLASSGLSVKDIGPYSAIPGHHFELQDGRCLKKEYAGAKKCTICNHKQARSNCLFHGVRVFIVPDSPSAVIDEDTATFLCTFKAANPRWELPTNFNRTIGEREPDVILKSIALGISRPLQEILDHASLPQAIRRNETEGEQRICGFCWAPFFMQYWSCGECGRDYCDACYDAIQECVLPQDHLPVAVTPDYAMKLAESARNDTASVHSLQSSDTQPSNISSRQQDDYSRLVPSHLRIVNGRISDKLSHKLLSCFSGHLHGPDSLIPVTTLTQDELKLLKDECNRLKPSDDGKNRYLMGYSEVQSCSVDSALAWETERPMVISGIGDKLEVDWGPMSFARAFPKMDCEMQDCSTGLVRKTKIPDFFDKFGKDFQRRDGTWKLKVSRTTTPSCGRH